jgi:hypothetical protein
MKHFKLIMVGVSIMILGNAQAQVKPEKQKKNLFQIGTTSISFLDGNGLITDRLNDEWREFSRIPYMSYERSFLKDKILVSGSFYYFQHAYCQDQDWTPEYFALYRRKVKNFNIGISTPIITPNKNLRFKTGLTLNKRFGSESFYLREYGFCLRTTGQTYNSYGFGSKIEIEYMFYKGFVLSSYFELCHYKERKREPLSGVSNEESSLYQPNKNQAVFHLALGYKI